MVTLRIDRLEELIKADGREINALAALAEVSPEYIWKLRHGKAPNVSAVVLGRLAETFGVSLDYLVGVEKNEHGFPVPAPELVAFVARINRLGAHERRLIARMGELLLELLALPAEAPPPQPQPVNLERAAVHDLVMQLLNGMPEYQVGEYLAALARETHAQRAALEGTPQSPVDAPKAEHQKGP